MKMKTRVAMLISISGVLVAGSAAALVNTQVLSGNADPTPFDAQVKATPDPSSSVVVETVPATTVAPVASPPVPSTVPPNTSTQAVYPIGDSAATIDTAGDTLTIVSLAPAAGWTVTKAESDDPHSVEIKLQSGTTELEFHANMLFGVVTTSVETHDSAATANSTSNTITSNSVDDHSSGGHGADDNGGGSHGGGSGGGGSDD
jgi:uncharacterized membrane protein YgcG